MDNELYSFLKTKLLNRCCVVIKESGHSSDIIVYRIRSLSLDGRQVRMSAMRNGSAWSDIDQFRVASKSEVKQAKRLGVNDKCRTLVQLINDLKEEFKVTVKND